MPTEGIIDLQCMNQIMFNKETGTWWLHGRSLFRQKICTIKSFFNYIYNQTDKVIKEADVFLALISLIYELNYVGLEYTIMNLGWNSNIIQDLNVQTIKTWCYYNIHSALRTLVGITFWDHFGP